jgi:hypothetical protein
MGCVFSFGAKRFFLAADRYKFFFSCFVVVLPLDLTSHIATLFTFLPSGRTTPTLVPYLLSPIDIVILITSYPIDLDIVLTTYPTNLATLLTYIHNHFIDINILQT